MQLLTTEQSAAWVARWHPAAALFPVRSEPHTPGVVLRRFHVPDYSCPIHTQLRQAVSWMVVDRGSVLVWVHEYGVWNSSEDWNLYYRWRRSMGDSGVIEETPGHMFMAHEAVDAISLLLIARVFGWGFRAVCGEWRRGVSIDHDGHGIVVSDTDASLAEAPKHWYAGAVD